MSNVRQEDIAEILNKINETLEETGCMAVGYDNTGAFLEILVEKGLESEPMYTEEQMESQGNNGPIRAIVAEDVLVKLNELATSGILADEWRNVIMDAFTLIWIRNE